VCLLTTLWTPDEKVLTGEQERRIIRGFKAVGVGHWRKEQQSPLCPGQSSSIGLLG